MGVRVSVGKPSGVSRVLGLRREQSVRGLLVRSGPGSGLHLANIDFGLLKVRRVFFRLNLNHLNYRRILFLLLRRTESHSTHLIATLGAQPSTVKPTVSRLFLDRVIVKPTHLTLHDRATQSLVRHFLVHFGLLEVRPVLLNFGPLLR